MMDGLICISPTAPPVGNVVLKNQGGESFINISPITGTQAFELCWGAQWLDYNNDMWLDLYVGVRNWSGVPGVQSILHK